MEILNIIAGICSMISVIGVPESITGCKRL